MNFKNQILNDISGVFLNIEEFGDTHNIDGEDVTVIVDDDLLEQKKLRRQDVYEETYCEELLFHVAASDLPKKPIIDEHMEFDGESYRVQEVTEESGMYTVTLGANRE